MAHYERQYTINGTALVATYEGCDYHVLTSPSAAKELLTYPTESVVAYFNMPDGNVFYVNKLKRRVTKLTEEEKNAFHRVMTNHSGTSLTYDLIQSLETEAQLKTSGSESPINLVAHLTAEQRKKALNILPDPDVNSHNSPYTYILQTFLAKYRHDSKLSGHQRHEVDAWMETLHEFSAFFIDFESFINNPPSVNPQESIAPLLDKLNKYKQVIKTFDEKNDATKKIREKLLARVEVYTKHVQSLQEKPSKYQVDCLMSVQCRDLHIESLGSFMAASMIDLLETGLSEATRLEDAVMFDLLHTPCSVGVLSDAKAMIAYKAFSMDGAEYNDTYSPMPKSLLARLTRPQISDSKETKPFSFLPYLGRGATASELDEALCLVLDHSLDRRIHPGFSYGLFEFTASLFELATFVPARFVFTVSLSVIDVVCSGFGLYQKKAEDKWTNYIDSSLSIAHARYSPVRLSKKWSQKAYSHESIAADHQTLLDQCKNNASYFHTIFLYVQPQFIADYVHDFVFTAVRHLLDIPRSVLYFCSIGCYDASPEAVYDRVALSTQLFPPQKENNVAEDESKLIYCPKNDIASLCTVFRAVMVGLSDSLIDPMFRKSPAFSSLYFMIALAGLVTYVTPVALLPASSKALLLSIQNMMDQISMDLTGTPVESFSEEMIATFAFWKVTSLSTELLVETVHGDFNFLKKIFKNTDQGTLMLMSCILLGQVMQVLPYVPTDTTLPSGIVWHHYIADVWNICVLSSKNCSHAMPVIKNLEFSLLGLQVAILLNYTFAGQYVGEETTALRESLEESMLLAVQCVEKNDNPSSNLAAWLAKNTSKQHLSPTDQALLSQAEERITQHISSVRTSSQKDLPDIIKTLNVPHLTLPTDRFQVAYKLYDFQMIKLREWNNERENSNQSEYRVELARLDAFYNQYCYQGSLNFFRAVFFMPIPLFHMQLPLIYFAVVAWRLLRLAAAYVLDKPSMTHQVMKSFSKDLSLVFQMLGIMLRVLRAFNRALSEMLRGIIGVALFPVVVSAFVVYKGMNALLSCTQDRDVLPATSLSACLRTLNECLSYCIALHQIPMPFARSLRVLSVMVSRVAGSHHDVSHMGEYVGRELSAFGFFASDADSQLTVSQNNEEQLSI